MSNLKLWVLLGICAPALILSLRDLVLPASGSIDRLFEEDDLIEFVSEWATLAPFGYAFFAILAAQNSEVSIGFGALVISASVLVAGFCRLVRSGGRVPKVALRLALVPVVLLIASGSSMAQPVLKASAGAVKEGVVVQVQDIRLESAQAESNGRQIGAALGGVLGLIPENNVAKAVVAVTAGVAGSAIGGQMARKIGADPGQQIIYSVDGQMFMATQSGTRFGPGQVVYVITGSGGIQLVAKH